jgi:type III pantothenate kinase
LVIDIGNTRSKAVVFDRGVVVRSAVLSDGDATAVLDFLGGLRPTAIVIGSVAEDVTELANDLNELAPVLVVTGSTPLPIRNAYGTPLTLGVDRSANAVAAVRRFPGRNVLVIDAGSCITYDLVDSTGTFRGGAISPGLQMRVKAMNTYSVRLPLVDLTEVPPLLGGTTEEALQAGVHHGAMAEMSGFIHQYADQFPQLVVILTGGDGLRAARALKNGIFAVPFLTLEGLHAILDHHLEPGGCLSRGGAGPRAAG